MINDERVAWECLITHTIHQHGAFLNGANTSGYCHNHQADGNDYQETGRCKEMIVHKDVEIIENRRDFGSDSHKQKRGEL